MYTIFLGDELWENVIDDMNSTSIWAEGGLLWNEKEKAEACIKNLQNDAYGFESEEKKFRVVELKIT